MESSNVIDNVREIAKGNKHLKHFYLGIDYGNEYKEIDIICSNHHLLLDDQEYILHDDFDWLYDELTNWCVDPRRINVFFVELT